MLKMKNVDDYEWYLKKEYGMMIQGCYLNNEDRCIIDRFYLRYDQGIKIVGCYLRNVEHKKIPGCSLKNEVGRWLFDVII